MSPWEDTDTRSFTGELVPCSVICPVVAEVAVKIERRVAAAVRELEEAILQRREVALVPPAVGVAVAELVGVAHGVDRRARRVGGIDVGKGERGALIGWQRPVGRDLRAYRL